MFKAYLAVLSYLLIGSSGAALADALHDCARLSGDAAIQACDQAIRQNPRDAVSYANRGVEYRNKGDLERALADFTKAIAIDPKVARAYTNRGLVLKTKGDLDRAIADYDKAIELDPKHLLAYYDRGNAWSKKGTTAPLPITTRPSPSIRNLPSPTTIAASSSGRRAISTAPSPITARPSRSIRSMSSPTTIAAGSARRPTATCRSPLRTVTPPSGWLRVIPAIWAAVASFTSDKIASMRPSLTMTRH